MNDDPRWLEVWEFIEWWDEHCEDPSGSAGELQDRWKRYCAALKAIADDPAPPSDQRDVARDMLDDFAAEARAEATEALKVFARVAERPDAEGTAAEAALENALVMLRDVIDNPDTSAEVREQAFETRRRFLAS